MLPPFLWYKDTRVVVLSTPVFRLASFSLLFSPFTPLFLPIVSCRLFCAKRTCTRDHHAVASQTHLKRWCPRWSRTSSISAEDRPSSTASLRSVHPRSASSRERTVTSFGVPIHHRASRNHRRVYHRCDGETVQSRVERWRQLRGNPPVEERGRKVRSGRNRRWKRGRVRCDAYTRTRVYVQPAVRFATTSGWERTTEKRRRRRQRIGGKRLREASLGANV